MRPDRVSICRSDGSGEGSGVIHPNIQRGPYGVRDRHRHPVMAVERQGQFVPGAEGTGRMLWYKQHKWGDEGEYIDRRNNEK